MKFNCVVEKRNFGTDFDGLLEVVTFAFWIVNGNEIEVDEVKRVAEFKIEMFFCFIDASIAWMLTGLGMLSVALNFSISVLFFNAEDNI